MSIKISGIEKIDQLTKQMADMPRKVATKVARTGLRKAAKVIQADARATAPINTGLLKTGIKVRSARRKKDRIRIHVSSIADARNLAIEFGTQYMDDQPFLIPAAEKNETLVLNILADSIEQSLIDIFGAK